MSKNNLVAIKKRAGTIQSILKLILNIGVIICVVVFIGLIISFLASPDRFYAVKGTTDWSLHYKLTDMSSFFLSVPFEIIQPLDINSFSVKYAAITCLFTFLLRISLILYGIKQVEIILRSMAIDISPFTISNVKSLKKLARIIIIYSVAVDVLSSLLFSAFVTKVFYLNLSSIHLSGLLIGGVILVIADIFQYGVFLQNEFDSTL